MSRILLIDDDAETQQRLGSVLRGSGFDVQSASTARRGLAAARASAPSLILLDVLLPDGTGLEVCRALRANASTAETPILMLSVKGGTRDRVLGLESGADDYVGKPFDSGELLLRVRSLLRRTRALPDAAPLIVCGRLRVDRGSFRTWVDGREVMLTALEFRLLLALYDRRDRVQSRDRLLQDVWEESGAQATSTVVTRIKLLRKKLKLAAPYIETMRGVGYRFAPPSS